MPCLDCMQVHEVRGGRSLGCGSCVERFGKRREPKPTRILNQPFWRQLLGAKCRSESIGAPHGVVCRGLKASATKDPSFTVVSQDCSLLRLGCQNWANSFRANAPERSCRSEARCLPRPWAGPTARQHTSLTAEQPCVAVRGFIAQGSAR